MQQPLYHVIGEAVKAARSTSFGATQDEADDCLVKRDEELLEDMYLHVDGEFLERSLREDEDDEEESPIIRLAGLSITIASIIEKHCTGDMGTALAIFIEMVLENLIPYPWEGGYSRR